MKSRWLSSKDTSYSRGMSAAVRTQFPFKLQRSPARLAGSVEQPFAKGTGVEIILHYVRASRADRFGFVRYLDDSEQLLNGRHAGLCLVQAVFAE